MKDKKELHRKQALESYHRKRKTLTEDELEVLRERNRKYMRSYFEKNPESYKKIREGQKEYYSRNDVRKVSIENAKKFYQENREIILKYKKEQYQILKENPEYIQKENKRKREYYWRKKVLAGGNSS